jgi:hypothetical protein
MERYEQNLIAELSSVQNLIDMADCRDNGFTHAQKHFILQTALLIIKRLKEGKERELRHIVSPPTNDDIPF